MTGNLIADFDPTTNVTEIAGPSEYVWVFGRWMRRPPHCAPEVPKPDSQQRKRKCQHASHDREKPEHGCVREAPRPATVEKPRDNGKRRRCDSHDKKLVEVKADHTDIKAEKSITPRLQASESPDEDRVDFALKRAEKGRASMVATWKKLANGKGKPFVERSELAGSPGVDGELFNHHFQSWLSECGLEDALERDPKKDPAAAELAECKPNFPCMYYKYKAPSVPDNAKIQPGPNWKRAYHGTWFYGLRSILRHGVLLESNDKGKGHEFSEPGLCVAPGLAKGIWFAKPHAVFDDGHFHRAIIEVAYDPQATQKRNNKKNGNITVSSDGVAITAVIIQPNSPPSAGEERFMGWDDNLEIIPRPVLRSRRACDRQRRRDDERRRQPVVGNDCSSERERSRPRESSLVRLEAEGQLERERRRREYEARRESYIRRAEEAWREHDELRRQHAQREEEARRRRRSLSPPGRFNAFSPSRRRRRRTRSRSRAR